MFVSGSDVEMLEAVLWQLGLSPQKGSDYRENSKAGQYGARINSDRGGSAGWTHTCQGDKADRRDVYYHGWDDCPVGRVSLEGMVRRFRGRNDATGDGHEHDATYAGMSASGVVDDDFLSYLSPIWAEYYRAYDAHRGNKITGFDSDQMSDWINVALGLWEDGDPAAAIPPTYGDDEHLAMLTAVGRQDEAATLTRTRLFRAWKAQEAPYHWGSNTATKNGPYQPTPFRITEGGADEVGSIGFSQIKYAYRYGQAKLRCAALQSYNLYEPLGSIKAMLAFVSAPVAEGNGNGNCASSFSKAFASNGAWRTFTNARGALRSYVAADGSVKPIAADRADDAYERLMKAIAGYNGQNGLNDYTWAHMLRTNHTTEMGKAASNRLYAMEVRARYGLSGRTYLWLGGTYPAGHATRPGEQWCFAYGEKEWRNPETIIEPGRPSRFAKFSDYQKLARLNDSRKMECM